MSPAKHSLAQTIYRKLGTWYEVTPHTKHTKGDFDSIWKFTKLQRELQRDYFVGESKQCENMFQRFHKTIQLVKSWIILVLCKIVDISHGLVTNNLCYIISCTIPQLYVWWCHTLDHFMCVGCCKQISFLSVLKEWFQNKLAIWSGMTPHTKHAKGDFGKWQPWTMSYKEITK